PGAPLIPLSRICPEAEHGSILERVGTTPTVALNAIVKNYAGDPFQGRLSPGTLELIGKLASRGKRVVLTVLGSPYAAEQVKEADAIVCALGDTLGSAEGALALLTTEAW
ncbi:MAG: hypothetical protein HYV36_06210, partial [Lentisphaerae bacterium]|nr:hypothetical protein [Lentisphaerota bacterium]